MAFDVFAISIDVKIGVDSIAVSGADLDAETPKIILKYNKKLALGVRFFI